MLNVKVTKQQMLWNNPPELKQHNFSDRKSGKKTKKKNRKRENTRQKFNISITWTSNEK